MHFYTINWNLLKCVIELSAMIWCSSAFRVIFYTCELRTILVTMSPWKSHIDFYFFSKKFESTEPCFKTTVSSPDHLYIFATPQEDIKKGAASIGWVTLIQAKRCNSVFWLFLFFWNGKKDLCCFLACKRFRICVTVLQSAHLCPLEWLTSNFSNSSCDEGRCWILRTLAWTSLMLIEKRNSGVIILMCHRKRRYLNLLIYQKSSFFFFF